MAHPGRAARIAAASLALVSATAFADTTVVGTVRGTNPNKPNGGGSASFTCFGMPNCNGTITVNDQGGECSNTFTWTTTLSLTGLDLTHAGSLSGPAAIGVEQNHTNNPDGTCTYVLVTSAPTTYTGTWDGTNGSL